MKSIWNNLFFIQPLQGWERLYRLFYPGLHPGLFTVNRFAVPSRRNKRVVLPEQAITHQLVIDLLTVPKTGHLQNS